MFTILDEEKPDYLTVAFDVKAPTFRHEMYEAYKDGADLGYLATEMADMYSASRNAVAPPEVDLSYDNVKDKLTVRLYAVCEENIALGAPFTAEPEAERRIKWKKKQYIYHRTA